MTDTVSFDGAAVGGRSVIPDSTDKMVVIVCDSRGPAASSRIARMLCGALATADSLSMRESVRREHDPAGDGNQRPVAMAMGIDELCVEIGFGLVHLIDNEAVPEAIRRLRSKFAVEFGFELPTTRVKDSGGLPLNGYRILVHDVPVAEGFVRPHRLMALNISGGAIALQGDETTEPVFGMPAKWIDEHLREHADMLGYAVFTPETVITTHLTEIIKEHMSALLTHAATQRLLDSLSGEQEALVGELLDTVPTSTVQKVLQGLLRERISIRNLPLILESIVEAARQGVVQPWLLEHVRHSLSQQISHAVSVEGTISIISLSPAWERTIAEAAANGVRGHRLTLLPAKAKEFVEAVRAALDEQKSNGVPVICTSAEIRPYVHAALERHMIRSIPRVPIVSIDELHPRFSMKHVGAIGA